MADARREARRARSAAAIVSIGRRAIFASDGYSITVDGLRINEDGCLVVQHASIVDADGTPVHVNLPLIVANLPLEPTPTRALANLLVSLAREG